MGYPDVNGNLCLLYIPTQIPLPDNGEDVIDVDIATVMTHVNGLQPMILDRIVLYSISADLSLRDRNEELLEFLRRQLCVLRRLQHQLPTDNIGGVVRWLSGGSLNKAASYSILELEAKVIAFDPKISIDIRDPEVLRWLPRA